ncbi:TonB family protein [Hymenobacter sp. BRD128]|uniref:TonB family protein n=1 Tax=Hymenobacter sp. BRD128 TaxID=2675878 RepID=UPI0015672719|nr:M56 family metallopeptidase [Hymenobacter sp. BRD128]QKG58683.1 TonB family protein [Hymenobacter sp. BRD128]
MDTSFLMGWLAGTLVPLGAVWLLFRLVLRRERCFGYNRALLLLAPVVALALPLLPRPNVASWLAPTGAPVLVAGAVALPMPRVVLASAPGWQPDTWLISLYLLGVLVSLSCLAYRYGRLRRATRHLPRERRPGYVLAYTGGRLPTSSFGRTIFWDDTAELTATEATSVLAHELGHVRQGHSHELLWLEVWRALLWFNPFAHLLLPALRLTHELLADWEAMRQVASPADALAPAPPYPSLLARLAVRRVAGPGYSSLVQSFAFSFTLTRIAMLQNQIPVRRWKQWLALPVLGGMFLATACQSNNEPVVPQQAATEKIAEMPLETLQSSMTRILEAKLAPYEQQRRAGQPLSAGQQRSYDYLKQQLKATQEMAPPPPPPPVLTTRPDVAIGEADRVYTYVEQMPHLPGKPGMGAIVEQIQHNLMYPAGPPQEGKVFASFTVNAGGSVGDTKIVKGLSPAYDEAVVSAIQRLPRFEPGQQSGQPVAVSFTVPVTFKVAP